MNRLVFSHQEANRATVRWQYKAYRKRLGIPDRCDNPQCHFHASKLEWNDDLLPLILDHRNGVRHDNRPKNLRYLCPNCDAQNTKTRGGANKGLVSISAGGFGILDRKSRLNHYTLVAEPAVFRLQFPDAKS